MITLVIGFGLLIAGVMANSGPRKSCGVSNHRYLSIGGIACIVHGMFAVSYYISATTVEKEEKKLNPHGPMINHTPGPMMDPSGPMMNHPPGPMMDPSGPMMIPRGPLHLPTASAPV